MADKEIIWLKVKCKITYQKGDKESRTEAVKMAKRTTTGGSILGGYESAEAVSATEIKKRKRKAVTKPKGNIDIL